MDDEDILEAGRTIRSCLTELAELPDPAAFDAAIAAALAAHDVEALRTLLWQAPSTRRWTKEFLRLGAPPELVAGPTRSGSAPPPGHGGIVAAPRFRCPQGDYVWFRRSAGVPVATCPSHHVRLVLDPPSTS